MKKMNIKINTTFLAICLLTVPMSSFGRQIRLSGADLPTSTPASIPASMPAKIEEVRTLPTIEPQLDIKVKDEVKRLYEQNLRELHDIIVKMGAEKLAKFAVTSYILTATKDLYEDRQARPMTEKESRKDIVSEFIETEISRIEFSNSEISAFSFKPEYLLEAIQYLTDEDFRETVNSFFKKSDFKFSGFRNSVNNNNERYMRYINAMNKVASNFKSALAKELNNHFKRYSKIYEKSEKDAFNKGLETFINTICKLGAPNPFNILNPDLLKQFILTASGNTKGLSKEDAKIGQAKIQFAQDTLDDVFVTFGEKPVSRSFFANHKTGILIGAGLVTFITTGALIYHIIKGNITSQNTKELGNKVVNNVKEGATRVANYVKEGAVNAYNKSGKFVRDSFDSIKSGASKLKSKFSKAPINYKDARGFIDGSDYIG